MFKSTNIYLAYLSKFHDNLTFGIFKNSHMYFENLQNQHLCRKKYMTKFTLIRFDKTPINVSGRSANPTKCHIKYQTKTFEYAEVFGQEKIWRATNDPFSKSCKITFSVAFQSRTTTTNVFKHLKCAKRYSLF